MFTKVCFNFKNSLYKGFLKSYFEYKVCDINPFVGHYNIITQIRISLRTLK